MVDHFFFFRAPPQIRRVVFDGFRGGGGGSGTQNFQKNQIRRVVFGIFETGGGGVRTHFPKNQIRRVVFRIKRASLMFAVKNWILYKISDTFFDKSLFMNSFF